MFNSTIDLALRYIIIATAIHLACAWEQAFHVSWPLPGAFELADTAEAQLFRSLGVFTPRSFFREPLIVPTTTPAQPANVSQASERTLAQRPSILGAAPALHASSLAPIRQLVPAPSTQALRA